MRLYRRLSGPFPNRLAAKLAVVVLVGLLPVVGAALAFPGAPWALVAGLGASLALTVRLVLAVLAPIEATNRALRAYLNTRAITPLPRGHSDALGQLMSLVTALMRNVGRELDAAVAASETDPLTELMNRRGFERVVPEMVVGMVLYIDVDHFKRVNDDWGHAVGDEALVNVADAISSALRSRDIIARIGGEEFAVFTDETVPARALEVAERVRARVREKVRVWRRPLTVSVGVAVADVPMDRALLLGVADSAVYEAKAQGRDCVVLGDTRQAA